MGKELNEYNVHIEWRDPNDLIPYEYNAKKHDGKNIANIAASIKKYGWQSYLVITKAGVIILGHGRRLAAIELGCKCPCKVIEDDLTDAEIRELRNVDNLTHEDTYDWEMLKQELDDVDLHFDDFDFSDFEARMNSIDESDLDSLFTPAEDKPPKDEEPEEIQCPHCKMWFVP